MSTNSNSLTPPVQSPDPEALLSTRLSYDLTAEHYKESFTPTPTVTLANKIPVTNAPHAAYSCGSTADRGPASLALIFQPGFDVILRGLMPKLSSKDLTRLRKAAAKNANLLCNLSSPDLPLPQVRCQNMPPLPTTRKVFQGTDMHNWAEKAAPRQPCRKELHTENIGADLAICDGYKLGLPTGLEHGKDFLVCNHCESLGKSRLRIVWPGTSIRLVGDVRATAELCADCALDRQILRPRAVCQCETHFENLTLCWDCRVEYPHQWLLDVICEAAASLPVMDSSVDRPGSTWSALERWVLPPGFEPRSGCLDCGINYVQSGQTWFDLWMANETSGEEDCLPCMTTPQSETVCLYCLLPVHTSRRP